MRCSRLIVLVITPHHIPLTLLLHPLDTASPEDPNELSFGKNDVLEIVDTKGKWWQAKRKDGAIGIVPSNYVSVCTNESGAPWMDGWTFPLIHSSPPSPFPYTATIDLNHLV